MYSKFLLGNLHMEETVIRVMGRTPIDLLARHAVCDFGRISARRLKQNMASLACWGEIQSEFPADPTDPHAGIIRITTSAGWGETDITWVAPQLTRKVSDGLPV